MKKLTILLLLFSLSLSAQREFSNWIFGHNAGIDFNHHVPYPILIDTSSGLNAFEGTSTISDSNGNLLFYTNGIFVWNRFHKLIPFSRIDSLFGSTSSTQSSLIVPIKNSTKFYVFTTPDSEYGITKKDDRASLCYSILDLSLDNGRGDIVIANQPLIKQSTEKLCGYRMSNGTYWVCGVEWNTNNLYMFYVDENGISKTIISSVGQPHVKVSIGYSEAAGEMHFSPDGSKLGYVNIDSRTYELFNFDTLSGNLTELFIDSFPMGKSYSYPYGCAFSPNGKYFYMNHSWDRHSDIYQLDLTNYSLNLIESYNYGTFGMQVGPDGKIYIIKQSEYDKYKPSNINVINKPNKKDCEIRENTQCVGYSNVQFGICQTPSYKIEIKDDEESASVEERKQFIPNVFSPNGDNLNDVFNPLNTLKIENLSSYHIRILDKWGNSVFEEDQSSKKGWNGKDLRSQKDCDLGSYFYFISINGKFFTQGEIILIR